MRPAPPTLPPRVIAFDGDDTLWHSEGYYQAAQRHFESIVGRYIDVADDAVRAKVLATERQNLKLFGYGAKGMTLSMIEAAIALTDRRVSETLPRGGGLRRWGNMRAAPAFAPERKATSTRKISRAE